MEGDHAMLLDHFHPPLSERHHWTSFHHMWTCQIAASLNNVLPDRWYAAPHVQFGVEIDDAVFDSQMHGTLHEVDEGDEPWTLAGEWAVPTPTAVLEFAMSGDAVGVRVFSQEGGPVLAGALELVSPRNKDRPESREAFVSKCETYLHAGIGLVVLDIVTRYPIPLHEELLARQQASYESTLAAGRPYAASYRPAGPKEHPQLQVWEHELGLGEPLGTIPFPLKRGPCLKLDLDESYSNACMGLKLTPRIRPTLSTI
jgi:hypothetical protein